MSRKSVFISVVSLTCLFAGAFAFAASGVGIAVVAQNVTNNLSAIAKLITAAAYVGGMAFAIGALVKFKAHKDAPQQVAIGVPIAYLFVGAALLFAPSVFQTSGQTLFGTSGETAGITGTDTFGSK